MTFEMILEPLIKSAILIGGIMTAAAYLVLLERWMAAWVQDRQGPNRVGVPLSVLLPSSWGIKDWKLFGLGQPLADGVKFILKEEYVPLHVDKVLYNLAPIAILTAALAAFAVVPMGHLAPGSILGLDRPIALVVAPNVDVGMIFLFAMSAIAVYGVILGGWASDNKYSLLGGLRSSAQMIAYEIPLGLGILGVVLACGSLRLEDVISTQALGQWNIFTQPLGFLVFMVAAFAEAGRLPFDLPETEQELVGGYHTEYTGVKLLLFLVSEFLHMILAAFLIVILFFGGWHLPWITGADAEVGLLGALLRVLVLQGKVFAVILFFMLVRWSWPRFRFDQLMDLAWKIMVPLGLLNLAFVAVLLEYGRNALGNSLPWLMIPLSWALTLGALMVVALASPLQPDNRPRHEPGEAIGNWKGVIS